VPEGSLSAAGGGRRSDMDDYITKPIRREDLFRVISEA
jgi:CheY-like chemotaxis protein